MPTPYQFMPMPDDVAQQIVDRARAAIQAVRAGGMRSPDPAVRLATVKMPLNGETYDDRIKAQHRLTPVVDDYERVQLDAYNRAIAEGAPHAVAHREAQQIAQPLKAAHDRIVAERRRKVDVVVETHRRRKLAIEREQAKKAGFR